MKTTATEIGSIIGKRRLIIGVPPSVGYLFAWGIGRLNGDVMLTRDEIRALMSNLLYVDASPAGSTKLSEWAAEHADSLGWRYASELARRADRTSDYRCFDISMSKHQQIPLDKPGFPV